MVFLSQRAPGGRLVCGGLPCVGHPLHSSTDPSGIPQAPVLAAHCAASPSVFSLLLPRARGVSQACPEPRAPGNPSPQSPRGCPRGREVAPKPRDALKERGGARGCRRLSAEPWKHRDLLLRKETEQVLARAGPGCAEPGPGATLHRPPVKIQTDPAFRGFCTKAGRTRIILVHGTD